jgi:hypothetical protein
MVRREAPQTAPHRAQGSEHAQPNRASIRYHSCIVPPPLDRTDALAVALSVGRLLADPENFRLAEADGATCVKLMPEWSKGYVRQATALFYQQKYKGTYTHTAHDPAAEIDAAHTPAAKLDFPPLTLLFSILFSSCSSFPDAVTVYAQGLARDPSSRLLSDGLASAQKHLAESATGKKRARNTRGTDPPPRRRIG